MLGTVLERTLPWRARSPLRMFLRVAVPVMLGAAGYIVASEGVHGLVALLPIIGAHVLAFLLIFPLWRLYRRRRRAATLELED